LRQLNLSETAITDEGLRCLAPLKTLWSLNVTGTRVTDTGAAAYGKAHSRVRFER
jgi:hypothetical protein